MTFGYNPFIDNFDFKGSSGGGSGITSINTLNATPQFVVTGSSATIDFGLQDLIIGSNPSGISGIGGNVGLGASAFAVLASGIRNVAVGAGALMTSTSDFDNVGIGYNALNVNNGASGNVAVGSFALVGCTTAPQNVAVGQAALGAVNTLGGNTGIGFQALENCAGGFNIGVGDQVGINYVNTESSNILIGNGGTATESNTIRIGMTGTGDKLQNRAFIAGISNQTIAGSAVVVNSSGQLGTGTPPSFFTPNAVVNLKDDFNGVVSGASLMSELGWTLSPSSAYQTASAVASSSHPGVLTNSAMTSANRALYLSSNVASGALDSFTLGGGSITLNWVFNIATLSTTINRYSIVIGMADTIASTAIANGVWLQYSDNLNSGNWTLNTSIATVATNTNSSVAASLGWHNAQIVINAAGTSAQYFMDGVSLGTVATTFPITGIIPMFNLV